MAHKEYGVTDIIDILRRAKRRQHTANSQSYRHGSKDNQQLSANCREHGFAPDMTDEQLTEIALAVFRAVHGPR